MAVDPSPHDDRGNNAGGGSGVLSGYDHLTVSDARDSVRKIFRQNISHGVERLAQAGVVSTAGYSPLPHKPAT
jgi:hypothetical protein